jgi:hypothetical protein
VKADEYRRQLRQQEQQALWTRFQRLYPEPVWAQMSEVQRTQAWASYQQNERVVDAARARPNLTWLWIVLSIAAALVALRVISLVLFY